MKVTAAQYTLEYNEQENDLFVSSSDPADNPLPEYMDRGIGLEVTDYKLVVALLKEIEKLTKERQLLAEGVIAYEEFVLETLNIKFV